MKIVLIYFACIYMAISCNQLPNRDVLTIPVQSNIMGIDSRTTKDSIDNENILYEETDKNIFTQHENKTNKTFLFGLFSEKEFIKEFVSVILGFLVGYIINSIYIFIKKWRIKCQEDKCSIIRYKNDYFARETIKYRLRNIVINLNNKYNGELNYLEFMNSVFNSEIFNNDIFKQPHNELFLEWTNSLNEYNEKKVSNFFINAPFIDVEHYFYYYILNKVNSQQPLLEKNIIDPFLDNKLASVKNDYCNQSVKHESKIKGLLDLGIQIKDNAGDQLQKDNIIKLLKLNLSANSTDLSQLFWEQFTSVLSIIDDSEVFWKEYVSDLHNVNKINIIVDNFGVEFLADIIMGYYFIIKKGRGSNIEIVYHVNELPIFVSDVKRGDDQELLKILTELVKDNTQYKELLNDISSFIENGNLKFKSDFFWNMPTSYDTILKPKYKYSGDLSEIKNIFTGSDLLIVKGDLNYRRMVGDRNYNPNRKIEKNIKYIKCPVLIIRSFKSNVTLLGNAYKNVVNKENIEQDWQNNGKYGIIQYIHK